MLSNNCPSSHYPGYSFNSHIDCVDYGYRIAYGTFKNLEENEEFEKEYIENSKIVVKFECKEVVLPEEKIVVPPKKPKIAT
tara:strand:+ start:442 stop:684 length:243 start_codon:yes stop_codon:yes gene_type:complete